ncbi:MAG: type IV pilus assembly protein PilM [Candidatus Doudnabacteria bacterium]
MWFSRQKSVLGVDIGTSDIKIVQINQDSKTLETYGIVNLPVPITTKITTDELASIIELLRNLVEKARVTTKSCVVSLPNSAVFTSIIDLPQMSDKELDSAVRFEAKKYVPLPPSDIYLSWTMISQNQANKTLKILIIAVPKQIRDLYVKIFEQAGLELQAIEIEALSLIRTLVSDLSKNDVIIDIGGKVTGINFVKEGLLHLTRNLNIGGDTITEKIAQALNLDVHRAQQFKHDFGLTGTEFLPEAVKPVLSSIKEEIKQLANLYKSHNVNIDRLVFTGGGSQMPGLVEYFNDLEIATAMGDTLVNISYPQEATEVLKRFGPQLSVAVGLALREV